MTGPTYADYLAAEQNSDRRHEFIDNQAATNPVTVVEVLSPTSDDDGNVIAAQDARCVKVYRRTERGEWRDEPEVYRGGEAFELPRLTRAISVDEI